MFQLSSPDLPLVPAMMPPHLQYAALCFRVRAGKPQFLLITSRGGHRWTLPKGWPMRGRTPAEAAAREAWEEAGVKGRTHRNPIGGFTYHKKGDSHPYMAMVFPLEVQRLEKRFPERGERKRRWVGRRKAAAMVPETELAQIFLRFDPTQLGS